MSPDEIRRSWDDDDDTPRSVFPEPLAERLTRENKELRAENERLRAKIRAVEALHEMVIEMGVRPWCEADGRAWPCPTVAALSDPSADHRVIDVDMTGLNGKAL